MSRLTSAAPIVGSLLIAVLAGTVITHFISPTPLPVATRPSPQPEALPAWARQANLGNTADGAKIYAQGVGNVPACATCHGEAGLPYRDAPYPRLTGLSADYVAKQLNDYATDIRQNEQMQSIARALNPKQRGAVASYAATLAPWQTPLSVAELNERGRTLDEVGSNEHALPACGNCHGLRGRGEGVMLPPLAGQPQAYLVSQLNAFRSQRRNSDTVEVMEGIASRMSPEDIEAVAQYFSALHPPTSAD